ncbi:carotenoid ester lipase precursor [Mycena maculata]|uniref:Carboxylic ester hydrolase n=1 Tax=Mycena maculata TaxID=230809 RepID=A0AAD7JLM3_9AGAR|nr:carotenoid ester lipase precursor [Mycena maculata]
MSAMYPFLLSTLLALNSTGGPLVALDYGVFEGATDGNLSTFLGVPFSQPAARFELPEVPTLLHGVQNATAFGAACPQQATDMPIPLPISYTAVSEDCLTLNVFTPSFAVPQLTGFESEHFSEGSQIEAPESKLPVFVWFYGGGFEIGASADSVVGPVVERSILTDQPVIIVTPNYRVSAFGFLAGAEAADAGITNLGLRDQIFALEWVQTHIAAFGGDPERVVIGGPSAGAISAALLLLDNKRFDQRALFRGAFMLSGAPPNTGTVAEGQSDYDGLVAANNCTESADTLECLKQVPFDDFMATVNHTTNLFSYSSANNIWRPRVDGDVVVHHPLVSVTRGLYAKIPIVIGTSDDEGTLFSLINTNITTNDEFVNYIHTNYLPRSTSEQIANISVLYPDDPAQGSPFDTGSANEYTPQFKRLSAFQGDYIFIGARRLFLESAAATQPAWSWVNKLRKSTPIMGSAHCGDLRLWFAGDESLNDTFAVDSMINFINTLDPNHSLRRTNASAVFWPTWDTPSENGSTSLLTLSDSGVDIVPEDFRVDAIRVLFELLLEAAEKSG